MREIENLRNGMNQVLGTLTWAEENVPGTNLQSDIIMLRDVCLRDVEIVDARIAKLNDSLNKIAGFVDYFGNDWRGNEEKFFRSVEAVIDSVSRA